MYNVETVYMGSFLPCGDAPRMRSSEQKVVGSPALL